MKKKFLASLFSVSAILTTVSIAHAEQGLSPLPKISEEWRFEVTPYIWGSGVSSTLFYNDRYLNTAKLSTNNVLGDLKSGGMIAAEAHYGNWGIMGDLVSATLQTTSNSNVSVKPPQLGGAAVPANVADKVTLQQNIITGAVTYTALNNQNIYLDGLLGARGIMATATVSTDLSAYGYSKGFVDSKSVSTLDPIVGFKGRYRISDSTWYIPFYADIGSGGGTTNLTWQAMAGIGKTFNQLIDASLTYRALYYDMKDGGVLQKTTMLGPQVAVTFKF